MANPWDLDEEVSANPWDADEEVGNPLAKPAPRVPTTQLFQQAQAGDPAARDTYNTRARTYGQNTLEQDAEQNSPVAGQNFAQNAWQSVGRYWPNMMRNFDSPAEVEEARRIDAPLMGTGGGVTGTIASNVAMLAAPQSKLTAGLAMTGKAAPFLSGATIGAVAGATEPVGEGESRLGNTGRAAIWGVGGELAGQGLSATGKWLATKATPAQIELYKQAQRMGIDLTPAQLTDSRWVKTIASQSKYWPGSGFTKGQQGQQVQFNRAVSRTLGENSDVIDDQLMSGVKSRQAALYNDAFDNVTVKLDQPALTKYQALNSSLERRISPDQTKQFNAISRNIGESIKGGKIEGKVYQELRKELKAIEAQNPNGLGAAVKDLRAILEDAASRSVPADKQAALRAADQLTRNFKVVEKARTRVANAGGDIAPTSLWQPANSKYGATPEMRELSRLGQMIKDPIADSGTAARLDTLGLYGLATALPKMGASRVVNSPLMSRYLAAQPKVIQGTSRTVGKAIGRAGAPAYLLRPKDEKKK